VTLDQNSVDITAATGGAPGTATVTLSYQSFTEGAPSFASNANTNEGQGWLSVTPSSGTMTLASKVGLLYTYSVKVTVNADPANLTAGKAYTGTVNFSSAGAIASLAVTLNVSSQASKYSVAPQSLSFSYQQGAASAPPSQILSVFSTPAEGSFTASSNQSWLKVDSAGKTPAALTVSVNVTGLAPNTYTGTITIKAGTSVSIPVTVTLKVTAANAPQLYAAPLIESLSRANDAPALSALVTVGNGGGGTLQYSAASDSDWLTVATGGTAVAGSPSSLPFSVNPASLTPGTYTGHITLSDSGSSAQALVTIVLTVTKAAAPSIQLSKSGVTMTAVAGGSAPPAETVSVTNGGTGTLDWTTQVSTTSGGSWLTAAKSGDSISIKAIPTGLAAGQYYGAVNVVAADATNSPQTISVALNVVAASSSPGITASTGGILLTGTAGSATPLSQNVTLFNPSSTAVAYSAAVAPTGGWLSVSPASGSANAGSNSLKISEDLSKLTAGVQQGTVTLGFGDGTSAAINVVVLVLPQGTTPSERAGLHALALAACSGGKASYLLPIFRSPANHAVVNAASAVTVQAQVIDDCGHAITAAAGGSVQVTFSNGDTGINLHDVGGGVWEATWTPATAGTSVVLNVAATAGGLTGNPSLSALSSVSVTVKAADANSAPQPTGVANAASAGQAIPGVVAPGSYIAIYGTGLAGNGDGSAKSIPLPTTLNGTQLFLGGVPMPLLYAGPTQVNALVPQGIAPNASYPLVVVRGTAESVPVSLTVTQLQPGAYTVNTSGSGPGIVTNALTGGLISTSNPAHVGDFLVIYGTGLGALEGASGETQPGDGAGAPGDVVFHTKAAVSVTVGGVKVPALFSGLTPSFAGLYQVNIQVPDGVTPGDAVPLVITEEDSATGATGASNTVTIAVQ